MDNGDYTQVAVCDREGPRDADVAACGRKTALDKPLSPMSPALALAMAGHLGSAGPIEDQE